ncbi:MAG: PDZ domain-containing protein [Deltaproteobacteria bacterium]|jgi:membrane-associated protease RseP (regulator of RpoE activity)|nr:PDZ domain-containing protein [Deltaproteobacteria bacterium]
MRLAVLCLILLTACSGYDDLRLLEVESIEPAEIEPGTTLRIAGHGFPLGRPASVQLHGEVYRPGASVTPVDATLEGVVRSESLVEVPIESALIDALGGRATLEGELRVAFRAADRRRDVFAVEPIRLDFLPETATQLRSEGLQQERDDAAHADGFGVQLSREELGTPGVRVLAVEPGSLAALQGVQPGDVVVGLDGVSIYGWRDFAPNPSTTESTVLVSREGLRGIHALRWPHEASERTVAPSSMAIFVLLGLLLGWGSPAALCLRTRYARNPARVWLVRTSLVVTCSVLMLCVPVLQWATMWILVLGTFAALFSLATRERVGSTSLALAVGAILSVMLVARTASLTEISGAQGPEVLRWFVFQSPASSLAFAAYVVALGGVSARPRLSASLYAAPAAVLGAVLFLGGWPLAPWWVGSAILATKAAGILVAARALDVAPRVSAGLCASALALAVLGLSVDLGLLFPPWSALAVGTCCALCVRAIVPPLRGGEMPMPA